jgi:hypothetical protein
MVTDSKKEGAVWKTMPFLTFLDDVLKLFATSIKL